MKKILITFLSVASLFIATSALAYVTWNTDPGDCPGSGIGNFTTGAGIPASNSNDCWDWTNVGGNGGDSINVQLYYHNTGNQPANNTVVQITVSPTLGQVAQTHTFTSNLTSSQGGKFLGTTTLTLSTPAALTFGSTYWYPNQGNTYIVSGSQIVNGGLSLGTINNGWPSQGSTVTSFTVNSTPPPVCSISTLTANPNPITSGQTSNLSWVTNNCTSATISPGVGSVYPVSSGGTTVSPATTTTYIMTAYGAGGSMATKSTTLNVTPVQNCAITSFNITPHNITAGQSVNISWNTTNCNSVNVTGSNFNSDSLSNSGQTIYPLSSGNYTITAQGGNNTYVQPQSIYVTVTNLQTTGTLTPSSPSCTIPSGSSSCTIPFSWNVVNPPAGSQSAVTQAGGGTVATGHSGNQSFTIPHNSATFYLYNNAVLLDTDTVTSSCANGSTWNGNSCAPVVTCAISNFTANPISITSGQSSTLSWNTVGNCTMASISQNIGSVNLPSGTQSVSPFQTTTYTLTVSGPGFIQTQTQSVTINVGQVSNCSISSFTANPTSITSGQNSTLSWSTSGNCASASISPNIGSVNVSSGTQLVSPTTTTTYILTVIGSNGNSMNQSVTVNVGQPQNNCVISSFTANGSTNTTIQSGGSANLAWATTGNCTSASISPTVGSVNVQSGNQLVSPTNTTTYTLSVQGVAGSYVQPQSVVVNVNQAPTCVISNFTVNGSSTTNIQSGGTVNIVWNTNNCSTVNVSGPGFNSTSLNYSNTIYPTSSGTYTLTATNTNGTSVTPQSVYVNVNTVTNNCSITNFTVNGSNNVTIQSGNAANLVWNTTGNNCYVSVSGPNFSSNNINGSQTIYPTYSGTYTLSLSGNNSGTQTQSVYVNVTNNQYNNCVISYFNATPNTINYGGVSTLSWSTSNCSSVSISNIGTVNPYGSQNIYPTTSTSYIINAYGSNGGNVSQSAFVTVNSYIPPTPVNNTCAVTTVATNITKNTVTLNGLVTSGSTYNSNTYFEYGTTVNLGSQTAPRSASGNTTFSETLTGLIPNTIYFYRLNSNCNNGTSKGAIEIFQTLSNGDITRIIVQGQTVIGTESPIMLKIENRYQSIQVGDTVDYTITYKNISNKKLTNSLLQVILPKGIAYMNSSRGTYSSNTYTLSVPIGDLNPNDTGQVYLQASVDSISTGNAQIVTTALLVYTNEKGAQENAMAYVLNNPSGFGNGLLGLALFGWFFNLGIIGWLLLIIIILLIILIVRKYYYRRPN